MIVINFYLIIKKSNKNQFKPIIILNVYKFKMDSISKLNQDVKHYDPHVRTNAVIGFGRYFEDDKARNGLKDEEKANIISTLLTCLEPKEKSIEVKGKTVKTFTEIAKFLKEAEIIQIFSRIINYLSSETAEGKDIYVTCIKSIFNYCPGSSCYMIGKVIVPILTKGIIESKNKEINQLCLDAFTDYIRSFDYVLIKENASVIKDKDKIIEVVVNFVTSGDLTLQTNAINFIGEISILLNKKQIDLLSDRLNSSLKTTQKIKDKIAIFHTLNSIAKSSANKQLEFIDSIYPLITQYTTTNFLDNDSNEYDEKTELAESALNLLESYINKILSSLEKHAKNIIENSLILIEYDPNYSYENAEMEIDDGYDEYEDYDQTDFANMDDSSWKVRRAACHVLHAFQKSGHQFPQDQKESIIKKLVECLREHDENTKIEIISCLVSFLSSIVFIEENETGLKLNRMSSLGGEFIPTIVSQLIESILKDLKGNNQKMIENVLLLLPVLASVGSSDVIGAFDLMKESFDAKVFVNNNNIMIFFDFLSKLFIVDKDSIDYKDIFPKIIVYIEKGITNDFYRINIAAINAAVDLIPILAQDKNNNKNYILKLYNDILPKFKKDDIDPELKSSLINIMSQIIIDCGDILDEKTLILLFQIYLEKTHNDIIKPKILTMLNKIIGNGNKLPLTKAINQFKKLLVEILKASPLHIQFLTLSLLETIFKYYPESFKGDDKLFVDNLLNMKSEGNLISSIYNVLREMEKFLSPTLLEYILKITSKKLDTIPTIGNQLDSLYNFTKLSCEKVPANQIISIINEYEKNIEKLNQNKLYFISILACASGKEGVFINKAINDLSSSENDQMMKNALILIGNICENSKNKHNELIKTLESKLQNSKDENKNLICVAIGKIGLNDPSSFIQKISNSAPSTSSFISLKEFLSLISEKKINLPNQDYDTLFVWLNNDKFFEKNEFSDLCGECLGLIAQQNEKYIEQFIKGLDSNLNSKKVFSYGIKFILGKKEGISKNSLGLLVPKIIKGLNDDDLLVKINSFNGLMMAAHNYNEDIKKNYNELMNIFKQYHKINKDWIQVADFGAGMKIINDKGIGIRKAVFTTIKIFVDNYGTKINVSETIQILINGLTDNEDIQTTVFACLVKLAHSFKSAFLPHVDNLCDTLKGVFDKIKSAESKKDFCENVQRLFDELKDEHDISENPKFVNLNEEISKVVPSIK